MKIKSNIANNFIRIHGEAKGIARHKKCIIKHKRKIFMNYYLELLIEFVALVILSYYFFFNDNQLVSIIAFIFLIIVETVFVFNFLGIISSYERRYRNDFTSSITVDDRGIIDESFDGVKMLFKWNKIKAVVVGRHCVVILTDTPIYLYFNKKDAKKIINAVEKNHKSTLIIE